MKTQEKSRIPGVDRMSPEDAGLVVLAGVIVITWGFLFLMAIVEKRSLRRHKGAGVSRGVSRSVSRGRS